MFLRRTTASLPDMIKVKATWRHTWCFRAENNVFLWTALDCPNALMGAITQFLKPTVGFEPTTTGLQNQSSTAELRWRNYYSIYAYIDLKNCIILHSIGNCCKKINEKLYKYC